MQAVRLEPFLARTHPDLVDRIRLVKVDAEGYDHFILDSIRGLIARTRPFIRTEVFVLASREQRIAHLRAIREMGYRIVRMRHAYDYVGEPLDEADVMRWKTYDVFCTPLPA